MTKRERQQLKQTQEQLEEVTRARDELASLCEELEAERAFRALVEAELASTREELAELKRNPPTDNTQPPAAELKLPESADLLNRLKARRKKSKADLADIEAILEMIED